MRDLQTKIGHADLATNEAQDALRREGEVTAGLRQELAAVRADAEAAHLRAAEAERGVADQEAVVAEERQARRSLEQSVRAAEAERDEAERLRMHSEDVSEPVSQVPLSHDRAPAPALSTPRKRGRPTVVRQPTLPKLELEPKPVKWWLTPPKRAIRRR